jgi:hypothetical protein
MESQQRSKTWKGRRRVWKKLPIPTPTSPPPPKKGDFDETQAIFRREYLFIYLFIYYPIEDKHERWGLGIGMCQFILISCGVL